MKLPAQLHLAPEAKNAGKLTSAACRYSITWRVCASSVDLPLLIQMPGLQFQSLVMMKQRNESCKMWSRYISGILPWRQRNRGLIPGGDWKFYFSPQHPPSFLSSGYRQPFPGEKTACFLSWLLSSIWCWSTGNCTSIPSDVFVAQCLFK
jgi:hypothetical protein